MALGRPLAADLQQQPIAEPKWLNAGIARRPQHETGPKKEQACSSEGATRLALVRYLHNSLHNLSEERLICLFADERGNLIAEEVVAEGHQTSLILCPRAIFCKALNLNAWRLVLAHNHPSGCATPSRSDIHCTRLLAKQARDLGIILEDHFVVGRREVVSMKSRGLF